MDRVADFESARREFEPLRAYHNKKLLKGDLKMKKFLSAILIITLLFSVSGCTGSISKAEKTVTSFMDSYCQFNLKDAFEHIENKDSYKLPFQDLEGAILSVKESMTAEMTEEEASDYVDSFIAPIFRKFVEKLSYKISDSKKEDDKFIFNIELASINSQNLSGSEYNPEELLLELTTELYENGTITEDMTEEEMSQAMFKPMMQKMTEYILETIENSGTETKTIKLVLKKESGKYLITEESDLEVLLSSAEIGM